MLHKISFGWAFLWSILLFFFQLSLFFVFLTSNLGLNEYNSINELKEDIKNYIDFYNYQRFHQTLDYKKPMEVYNEWLKNNNSKKENIKILKKIA